MFVVVVYREDNFWTSTQWSVPATSRRWCNPVCRQWSASAYSLMEVPWFKDHHRSACSLLHSSFSLWSVGRYLLLNFVRLRHLQTCCYTGLILWTLGPF